MTFDLWREMYGTYFMIARIFLSTWLGWWLWLNTVGRIPGGVSLGATLAFDALAVLAIAFSLKRWGKGRGLQESFKCLSWDLWLVPALLAVGSALFYCLLLYPLDWDGLDYHLPSLLEAVQAGRWGDFKNPYYAVQAFPKLAESIDLWWILHFGSHGLLLLGMIPLIGGALALASAVRSWGGKATIAIALWCTIPMLVKQASSLYIDNFVAFFGLLCLLAIENGDEVLFSLAMSFFVGAKFATVPAAAVFFVSWLIRRRSFPWLLIPAGAITLGGTVLPNWIQHSNPLYPFRLESHGKEIFPGPFTPSQFLVVTSYGNESVWRRLGIALSFGMDPVPSWDMVSGGWGLVLPIVGAIGFVRLLLRRKRPPEVEAPVALLVSQAPWMFRYHLWFSGALTVWAETLVSRMKRPLAMTIWSLLVLQALWLWLDRSLFLGLKTDYASAFHARDIRGALHLLTHRLEELIKFGEPQVATDTTDQWRIQIRKTRNQHYLICQARVIQVVAAYGADFSNQVIWLSGPPSNPSQCLKIPERADTNRPYGI